MQVGLKGTAKTVCKYENSAKAMGSGSLEVFATPAMVALMEAAAVDCVANELAADETTVGTEMSIKHLSSTPIGSEVVATSELIEVNGRELVFKVQANALGELIGEGEHKRVVVGAERFMDRTNAKL